jgi:hypothetical protein
MKKFLFLSLLIFFGISCKKTEKEEPPIHSGFGGLDGYLYFKERSNPLQGYVIMVAGSISITTDARGHFLFEKIPEGLQKIEVLLNMNPVYSTTIGIISDMLMNIEIPLTSLKGELPDFTAVDISKESAWDYLVAGKEEYFLMNAENSSPTSALYHSFKDGREYAVIFNNKGLPSRATSGGLVFLFENFNGNKVDLGILYPSGETQIIRGIKTDFTWPTSSKSLQSRADVIRWTSRILGAIPCVISGVAAVVSGGFAIPVALWTCGNYFLSMANNFLDDANVENGFTKFVDDYKLNSSLYVCAEHPDLVSCLIGLANKGLNSYADYVEEMETREYYINKLETLLANNAPLKEITLQPGSEGKDAWISMASFSDCKEFYDRSSNDSLINVIYDAQLGSCAKQVDRMLLQFSMSKIPVNAILSSARLELYIYATINIKNEIPTISFYKLKSSWSEADVSWMNQPEGELISNIDCVNKGQFSWYSLDVTSVVQDWVSGRENNYGFQILTTERTVYGKVYSGDHLYASRRPKLVISYY